MATPPKPKYCQSYCLLGLKTWSWLNRLNITLMIELASSWYVVIQIVPCSNFELSWVTMSHRLSRLDAGTGRGASFFPIHWGSLEDIMRLFKSGCMEKTLQVHKECQIFLTATKFGSLKVQRKHGINQTWHRGRTTVLSNLVSYCWSFRACRSLRWSSSKQKRQRSREQRPKRGSSTAVLSKWLLRNLHVYVPDYATLYATIHTNGSS